MANSRRTRSYRGGSRRSSGSGALIDTVRNTITGIAGTRGRGGSRGRGGTRRGGNLVSQASGFVSGLLSGGDAAGRSRGRTARRRR
jgi:hypothetical protein